MGLVAPVPLLRTIVRVSDEGEPLSSRRSPRRGRVEDIFTRLVSLPALLCHPQFELDLLLTHQHELRVFHHGRAFRRRGWVVVRRRLVSVEDRVRLTSGRSWRGRVQLGETAPLGGIGPALLLGVYASYSARQMRADPAAATIASCNPKRGDTE